MIFLFLREELIALCSIFERGFFARLAILETKEEKKANQTFCKRL